MTAKAIDVRNLEKRYRIPLDQAATLHYRVSHPRSTSRYRELVALDDITFCVDRGEFIGITGPNGCGKSTLLKVIAGILTPDAGSATVDGRLAPFLELGIGFKPELSARENIFLGAAILGLSQRETAERADTVLQFAELEDFADQKLKNFSSGMAVRLAFSVAMLADADILLMDEVLAVGDARFQEKCFEVFSAYKKLGRTLVLVSHDISSLELFCDRVVLLQQGRVIGDGPPHRVVADYRRIVATMSETATAPAAPVLADEQPRPVAQLTRWGTREVEVTRVSLVGPGGEQRHTFDASTPLSILVDYVGHEAVSFECGIRIRAASGHVLAKPFTRFSGHVLPDAEPGVRGTIVYHVPSLPLLQGSYFVSAYLYDTHLQHAYDHVEDAIEFRVADEEGRRGVIDLGGTWQDLAPGVATHEPVLRGELEGHVVLR